MMRDTIKKIIWQLFPEIGSGYHVPQLAEVVGVSDPPIDGEQSTAFRPYYAVDIQPLDKQLKADGPLFKGVPLPLPAAGHARGLFGLPQLGTLVSFSFAYGSPAHPIIANVYPHHGQTLPGLKDNELLWQQSDRVSQRCDVDGNWSTETPANLNEAIGEAAERIAGLKQRLMVEDGGTVWLGSESVNLVRVLDDLCNVVKDIANTASSHTHKYTDDGKPMTTKAPDQAGSFSGQSGEAESLSSEVSTIVES